MRYYESTRQRHLTRLGLGKRPWKEGRLPAISELSLKGLDRVRTGEGICISGNRKSMSKRQVKLGEPLKESNRKTSASLYSLKIKLQ